MLRVRKDLCIGCGLCAQSCPRGAISILWGQAEIDPNRCDSCGLCLTECPQGAIVEKIPVSGEELKSTVVSLWKHTDELLKRIERLKIQNKP